MKKILTQLQDAAYELEGLLMLTLSREDRQESISPLVLEKISAITKLGDELRMEISSPRPVEIKDAVEKESVLSADVVEESEYEINESGDAEEMEETMETMALEKLKDDSPRSVSESGKERMRNSPQRPVFCINDRFLFIRELFGNSSAAFDKAMDKVATMDSIEEAENYFISESGWNPENENVIRFMETLANYFDQD